MKKMTAQKTLQYLIELFLYYLEDLSEISDLSGDKFLYGEKTAYAECLEIIQHWECASEHGLDFNIEAKYPL